MVLICVFSSSSPPRAINSALFILLSSFLITLHVPCAVLLHICALHNAVLVLRTSVFYLLLFYAVFCAVFFRLRILPPALRTHLFQNHHPLSKTARKKHPFGYFYALTVLILCSFTEYPARITACAALRSISLPFWLDIILPHLKRALWADFYFSIFLYFLFFILFQIPAHDPLTRPAVKMHDRPDLLP